MRTTIDLPDELYRTLKARAALAGLSVKQVLQRFIEQGLQAPVEVRLQTERKSAPPVIIPPRGRPVPASTREMVQRIEAEEDMAKHARST